MFIDVQLGLSSKNNFYGKKKRLKRVLAVSILVA